MILPVRLNADSEDIVETGTVKTSLAKMERTGYDSLCSCHQLRILKSSSYWLTVSLSRYAANSEAFRLAPECAACSKAHADGLLVDEDAPPPSPGGRLALAPSPVAARLAPVPSPPARLAPAPSPPPGVPPKIFPQSSLSLP